jgi:ubiquinone biosynthesis protein
MTLRRFLAQFLIAAVAVAIVLWVMSLIHITWTNPSNGRTVDGPIVDISDQPLRTVLAFGLVLAIVNIVGRPLLLLLTGRWLIRSFGLVLFVVDGVVILVAAWIFPGTIAFAPPGWLWALIAVFFVIVLTGVAEVIFGVDRPQIDVSDRQRAIWRVLERLPTPRRSSIIENLRLMQVYDTISAFGFEIALESSPLAPVREWAQGFLRTADPRLRGLSVPAKVRVMLQQLGPTYVKIGQMAASRSEALPPGFAEELAKLQNTVPPFSWDEAEAAIQRELGAPSSELFASIEHEPLAAASLAQVHRATLPDGTLVAVKIERPDVATMVRADLGVLQELAKTAEKRFEIARRLDLPGVVQEFAEGVSLELDYRNEAYHMRRMAGNLASIRGVAIPEVDDRRSSSRVITMGYVQGCKISDVEALDAAGIDRAALAHTFLRAIIKQILIDGFFHADPHPGNILVDTRDGTIQFLDLGLVGQLTFEQRTDLLDLMASVQSKDSQAIASVAMRLCTSNGPVDNQAVYRAVDRIVYQYLIYGGGNGQDMGMVVSSILGSLYEQGLRMDQDFTLAIKSIIQADEITRSLSPDFSLLDEGVTDARELIMQAVTAEKIVGQVRTAAIQTGKEVLRRLPSLQEATLSWLDQYQKGKIVVEIDTADLSKEIGRFSVVGAQLAGAAIIAGAVIASGIVVAALVFAGPNSGLFYLLPAALVVGFLLLLVIGIVVAFRLLRTDRSKNERGPTGPQ